MYHSTLFSSSYTNAGILNLFYMYGKCDTVIIESAMISKPFPHAPAVTVRGVGELTKFSGLVLLNPNGQCHFDD